MEKVSMRKLVVFGGVLAVGLALVTWGFGTLKDSFGENSVVPRTAFQVFGMAGAPSEFGGLGLELMKEEGDILVVQTLDGTPADKAGVKEGDRIVKINDEPVGDDPDIGQVADKLRGKPGTEVTITVRRGDEEKTFTIERGKIKAPAPRIRILEGRRPGIEEWRLWEPEKLWPFEEGWQWTWRGDKKALEEYREALRGLREARRKMWESVPRPRPFWGRVSPEELFRGRYISEWPREKEGFRMDMDVHETDDAITIKCDMPGMKKEDIDISLKGNLLTIKGERTVEEETKDEEGKIVRKERRFGSFSRSFTIPGKVKTEDIKTSYENGVLTIVVPKEKPTPKKEEEEIKIKIGTI